MLLLAGMQDGVPHVSLFTEEMFDAAVASFHLVAKGQQYDVGCTGRDNYCVWYGSFLGYSPGPYRRLHSHQRTWYAANCATSTMLPTSSSC